MASVLVLVVNEIVEKLIWVVLDNCLQQSRCLREVTAEQNIFQTYCADLMGAVLYEKSFYICFIDGF